MGPLRQNHGSADLQLAAAIPTARWVEYITPAPYIEDLVLDMPFALDDEGFLNIPDDPGLGVRWDPDGVRRHSGLDLTPSDL